MENEYAAHGVASERARRRDWTGIALVGGVAVLTLATSYVHATLGGLLFTLTAIGYATLAAALVVPIGLAERFRWLVRLGLLGYVLSVIGGWLVIGARYDLAYIDKGIEVGLIAFLVASLYRLDGGPAAVLVRVRALPAEIGGLLGGLR